MQTGSISGGFYLYLYRWMDLFVFNIFHWLHLINASVWFTEIIAADNVSVRNLLSFRASSFTEPDHYCSTAVLHSKQPSHFSVFSVRLFSPLSCPSPLTHWQSDDSAVKRKFCSTHCIPVFLLELEWSFSFSSFFCCHAFRNEVFSPGHASKSFSHGIKSASWYVNVLGQHAWGLAFWGQLLLLLLLCGWEPLLLRHAALWAMINLWELSRWLSGCSAVLWAKGSSGDGRATSGRRLHSLITERPG